MNRKAILRHTVLLVLCRAGQEVRADTLPIADEGRALQRDRGVAVRAAAAARGRREECFRV